MKEILIIAIWVILNESYIHLRFPFHMKYHIQVDIFHARLFTAAHNFT